MEPTLKQLHQFYAMSQHETGPMMRHDTAQQIALGQLEVQLNCKLADQSDGKLHLTAAGKRLQQYCSDLLSQCANLQLTAQSMAQQPGKIRIVLDEIVPSAPILDRLPLLVSELPLHQLSVCQLPREQALTSLAERQADILIRCKQTEKPPRSASRHYSSLPLVFVAAPNHALCKGQHLTPDHLKLHRQLITSALPSQLLPAALDSWHIDHPGVLCDLVTLGAGWALVPQHWVAEALTQGRIKALHLPDYSGHQTLDLELLWLQQRREAGFNHCLNLLGALPRDEN